MNSSECFIAASVVTLQNKTISLTWMKNGKKGEGHERVVDRRGKTKGEI